MKVVHVVESMRRGGAETVVVEHVRLASAGVEPVVVALNHDGPAFEAVRAAGARTYLLGKGSARLAGLARLVSILRAERPVVVNGHNATGGLYATVAGALAGVPVRVRTEHTLHFAGRHSFVYPVLEPALTALTHRVVCVCDAVRASHATRMTWAAPRFVTVPNGISPLPAPAAGTWPGREAARAALGLGDDTVAFLTIGSLSPQKAQHVMLEAFAGVAAATPAARLLVAGEGNRRATLETLAGRLGIAGRLDWLGPREDAAALLDACDVFVLSSEREGLPMTILEAMRARRAVVTTRVGGTAEAVVDGVTGLVTPVGDPKALGAAMRALAEDPGRRAAFGAAGHALWLERFTAERMVRTTEAVYREALARGGQGATAGAGRAA